MLTIQSPTPLRLTDSLALGGVTSRQGQHPGTEYDVIITPSPSCSVVSAQLYSSKMPSKLWLALLVPLLLRLLKSKPLPSREDIIAPSDERVLLLGASSGVGRDLAHAYAKRNARVYVGGLPNAPPIGRPLLTRSAASWLGQRSCCRR